MAVYFIYFYSKQPLSFSNNDKIKVLPITMKIGFVSHNMDNFLHLRDVHLLS